MTNSAVFQVNYYVGTMLAEAGELRVSDTQIIFMPTGMIERIMGATGTVIPLSEISAFEYTGGLSRTVRIRTGEKIHRFEGSATSGFGEILLKLIPDKAVRRPSQVQLLHPFIGPKYSCDHCTAVLAPGLSFCTRCGAVPKGLCQKCRRILNMDWAVCGFCGTKVAAPSQTSVPPRTQRAA